MNKLIINPINNISGEVFIPGSKSISNRVLLLSSLSFSNETKIKNILDCDDVNNMINCLKKLRINIKNISNFEYIISGIKNINDLYNDNELILYTGNAGTVFRSLLSLLSICNKQNIILTGDERMKERPIKDLVNSLKQGGAKIEYLEKYGFPPLKIYGGYIGGKINIDGSISSQFLSSLLMISPLLKNNSILIIKNKIISKSYIDITIKIMKIFGIKILNNNYNEFYIEGNQYYKSPRVFEIEGDATSASYFISAGVIKNSNIKINGIGKNSIQGDIKFSKILNSIGAKIKLENNFILVNKRNNIIKPFNIDANNIPDSSMTLSIISLLCNSSSTIKNIYNWRVKECDRISAFCNEFKKIGINTIKGIDYITIFPNKNLINSEICTYNDHRIAMCFSLIPLFGIPITILNPDCVNKTFPNYFNILYSISNF